MFIYDTTIKADDSWYHCSVTGLIIWQIKTATLGNSRGGSYVGKYGTSNSSFHLFAQAKCWLFKKNLNGLGPGYLRDCLSHYRPVQLDLQCPLLWIQLLTTVHLLGIWEWICVSVKVGLPNYGQWTPSGITIEPYRLCLQKKC